MFHRRTVLATLVGCFGLVGACNRSHSGTTSGGSPGEVTAEVKVAAPDIEGKMLDDTPFSLKEKYASHVIMLDFWATWCGPCVMELPVLVKLAEEYQSRGVALYAVNGGEDVETVRDFLKERNWPLNVVLDPEGKHAEAYQVGGIPHLVLIDRNGFVRKIHVGYHPDGERELRADLDEILADAPNSKANAKPDSAL